MTFRFEKAGNFTYPITGLQINALSDSPAVEPRLTTDPRVAFHPNEFPSPSMPEDGDIFWDEVVEVARCVDLAKRNAQMNRNSYWLKPFLPDGVLDFEKEFTSLSIRQNGGAGNYTASRGAELVRADFPPMILSQLAVTLLNAGYKMRSDILPTVGYQYFTDGVVMLGNLIGWAIHTVSPTAFALKWYHGRPRPEEAIGRWVRGETLGYGPNQDQEEELEMLVDKTAVLADQRLFTMYEEGSPMHPASPAMHGAAAGASVLFGVFFELDDYGKDLVRRTAANVALYRDFAGVHYHSDSLLGLYLGEKVIASKIGEFLEQYGGIKSVIDQYAEESRTNWLGKIYPTYAL